MSFQYVLKSVADVLADTWRLNSCFRVSGLVFVFGFNADSASGDEEWHNIRKRSSVDIFDCFGGLIDEEEDDDDAIVADDVVYFALGVFFAERMINSSASLVSSADRSWRVNGSRYAASYNKEIITVFTSLIGVFIFIFVKIKTDN